MARHELVVRVYVEDTDAGGMMYHARYLAFAERGRTEALRALGASVSALRSERGLGFVVADLHVAYQRPLRLDDLVMVLTSVEELGGARCRLWQRLGRDGEPIADLRVLLACIRFSDLRPARIPPRWRAALAELNEGISKA